MRGKKWLIDLWALLKKTSGQLKPAEHNRNQLTLLMFHRCLPEQYRKQYPYPGLVITPEELDWLLALIKPHFTIGTISKLMVRFHGQLETPPLLGITFDDGQWDNLNYAHPVLERHDVNATFYIPTDPVDQHRLIWHDLVAFGVKYFQNSHSRKQTQWREQLPEEHQALSLRPIALVEALKSVPASTRGMLCDWLLLNVPETEWPQWARVMTWEEIRRLKSFKHEIGSHATSHQLLTQMTKQAITRELSHSKKRLETELSTPIMSVCYPNGSFNSDCTQIARSLGYTNGVSTEWGFNDRKQDVFRLKRMDVNMNHHRSSLGLLSENRTWLRLTNQYPGLSS